MVERSDANLHVLLRLLEMLASLKAAAWAGLTAAGLCATVKKAAGHRNRDVASKSAALLKVREGKVSQAGWAKDCCKSLMVEYHGTSSWWHRRRQYGRGPESLGSRWRGCCLAKEGFWACYKQRYTVWPRTLCQCGCCVLTYDLHPSATWSPS